MDGLMLLADVAERSKICSTCGIVKLKSSFHVDNNTKSGLRRECKPCDSDSKRRYRRSGKGKESDARYTHSVKGKERDARYKRGAQFKMTYRNRYMNDPHFRMAILLRGRLRKALKRIRYGVAARKYAHTLDLLGCSMEFFMKYIEAQFKPGMTWERYGEWHVDHIRPCASFDLTDPAQQKVCFGYKNLQPLWAVDNLKKGAKWSYLSL